MDKVFYLVMNGEEICAWLDGDANDPKLQEHMEFEKGKGHQLKKVDAETYEREYNIALERANSL